MAVNPECDSEYDLNHRDSIILCYTYGGYIEPHVGATLKNLQDNAKKNDKNKIKLLFCNCQPTCIFPLSKVACFYQGILSKKKCSLPTQLYATVCGMDTCGFL